MSKLNLAFEIRDFDLVRLGFSFSVLDDQSQQQTSEGYLQMTLPEVDAFLRALKAHGEIALSTAANSSEEPSIEESPEDGSSSMEQRSASLDLEEQLGTLRPPPKSAGFGFRRSRPPQEIRVTRA